MSSEAVITSLHAVRLCWEQLWETVQLNQTYTNILCRWKSDPVGAVHTSEPVASRMVGWALSGAQAIHSTTCSCSRNSALHSFEATTQTRTVWSLEQLAINEPSWLGRTILTHSLWPANVFTQYLEVEILEIKLWNSSLDILLAIELRPWEERWKIWRKKNAQIVKLHDLYKSVW